MKKILVSALAGAVIGLGFAAAASAQTASGKQPTPKSWNYEIRDGKRVPKADNRKVNPDGSWREEVRVGNCITIKEKTSAGEYRETRRCD